MDRYWHLVGSWALFSATKTIRHWRSQGRCWLEVYINGEQMKRQICPHFFHNGRWIFSPPINLGRPIFAECSSFPCAPKSFIRFEASKNWALKLWNLAIEKAWLPVKKTHCCCKRHLASNFYAMEKIFKKSPFDHKNVSKMTKKSAKLTYLQTKLDQQRRVIETYITLITNLWNIIFSSNDTKQKICFLFLQSLIKRV